MDENSWNEGRGVGQAPELLERFPMPVCLHRQGGIVEANHAMRRVLLGADAEPGALAGRGVVDAVAGADRRAFALGVAALLRGEVSETEPCTVRLETAEGRARPFEFVSTLITWQGVPTVCSVARDVSARTRMQETLARADRLATVGTLAAGVAHDINNPLSYLLMMLQSAREDLPRVAAGLTGLRVRLSRLLGDTVAARLLHEVGLGDGDALVNDVEQRLADAEHGAGRVRDVVADLRTFTRVGPARTGPVDLRPIMERAIAVTRSEFRGSARVELDYDDGLAAIPPVSADATMIEQVVVNLLVNAAHATRTMPDPRRVVRLRVRPDGGTVEIEVADRGVGMSADARARVFDPFFTTKPHGERTGLGLAVCRHLVEAAGGTIEIRSTEGEGTVAALELPATDAGAHPGDLIGDVEDGSGILGGTGSPGRVLVVEDEQRLVRAIERVLRGHAAVVPAPTGRAARDILLWDQDFDLLLIDVLMPEENGIELLEWIGDNRPALVDRAVFMTGGLSYGPLRDALERSGRPVLHKPVRSEALRDLQRRMHAARRRPERRAAPRYATSGMGLLRSAHAELPVEVVDWSVLGLRARVSGTEAPSLEGPIELLLDHPGGDLLTLPLALARTLPHDDGVDLGFRICSMPGDVRRVYQGLVEASAA